MCYIHPGSIHGPTRVNPGSLQGRSRVPTESLPSPSQVHPGSIPGPSIFVLMQATQQNPLIFFINIETIFVLPNTRQFVNYFISC